MALSPRLVTKLIWPAFRAAGPGAVLLVATILALAFANSGSRDIYHHVLHTRLVHSPIAALATLDAWINDALMAVFFLLVGLEIKREAMVGALADTRARRLPVIAALAGMVVPALVFLAVTRNAPELWRGWAIPAATDIAFAMAVIAVLGRRVPRNLRLFLLTVAIVDDIGAVMVIALFYATGMHFAWLAAAAGVLAAMIACNRLGVRRTSPYVLLMLPLWYCVLRSGVHPTVAGVVAAFAVPLRAGPGPDGPKSKKIRTSVHGPLRRIEHALDAPVNYLIMPLFGLANAGVALGGGSAVAGGTTLALAITAALVVGKQAGVALSVFACEALGVARRPAGTNALHIWGAALACGVGFTMSLFITTLAFRDAPDMAEHARLGILAGSAIAGVAAGVVLWFAHRRAHP